MPKFMSHIKYWNITIYFNLLKHPSATKKSKFSQLSVLSGPQLFITDRSNAVVLLSFSVACFDVRVSVMFHIIFSLVSVAELPPFRK